MTAMPSLEGEADVREIFDLDISTETETTGDPALLCFCPRQRQSGAAPSVGAAYNLFDGEELLEASILSIRPFVSYIVVIWQSYSNFGAPASPQLESRLRRLQEEGLVDELVHYEPQSSFTEEERILLSASRATQTDLGGARIQDIGSQFFNEVRKREIGRRHCLAARCDYAMIMDVDECYDQQQLRNALQRMVEGDYDIGVCRMRHYFKDPRWELTPLDDSNYVPVLYRLDKALPLRLGCPYPFLIDPTRKLEGASRLVEFSRDEVEMFHFSFVRDNISSKLSNVSNRANYDCACPCTCYCVAQFDRN